MIPEAADYFAAQAARFQEIAARDFETIEEERGFLAFFGVGRARAASEAVLQRAIAAHRANSAIARAFLFAILESRR